jgi:hypothetical protein
MSICIIVTIIIIIFNFTEDELKGIFCGKTTTGAEELDE